MTTAFILDVSVSAVRLPRTISFLLQDYGSARIGPRQVISPISHQRIEEFKRKGDRTCDVLASWATESLDCGMPKQE
jgi:hypothetical protein